MKSEQSGTVAAICYRLQQCACTWPRRLIELVPRQCAGPVKDLWVQIAGPLTHLPQAAFWAFLSVFSYHAWTKEWTTRVDFALKFENDHFVHHLFVGALWVRSCHAGHGHPLWDYLHQLLCSPSQMCLSSCPQCAQMHSLSHSARFFLATPVLSPQAVQRPPDAAYTPSASSTSCYSNFSCLCS
jgi:hypothetical protein